jgi:GNAT superfamily N-acetyltransferase
MQTIEVVPFQPELKVHFETINKEWVSHYFSLEPFDIAQLENPEDSILKNGGVILFAKLGEQVVGTVGLVPSEGDVCEMIKMGVLPSAQGKGVGMVLGKAIIEKAREMGFSKMELYSNTKLENALKLYKKLGFEEVRVGCNPYGRCDIKMELIF